MSLSARIELEPSFRVAEAELLVPLIGLMVASGTLLSRWPAHRTSLLAAAGVAFVLIAVCSLKRLRAARQGVRLMLSDRSDIDLRSDSRPELDGSVLLAESTVVWPGFWMLALRQEAGVRVLRLAIRPSELCASTRRPLARFLVWSIRARGGPPDESEKAAR